METEKDITGISGNLAESNEEHKAIEKKIIAKSILNGKRISVSISESEELEQLGLSDHHLKDVSIEIARYLIVNGATLTYGGDLRHGGFTKLFSELSYQYKYLSDRSFRFENYFFFPSSSKISLDDKVYFEKHQVLAHLMKCPNNLKSINPEKEFKPFIDIEDRYVISEGLTNMRTAMTNESDARILIGGKQKSFIGYYPGIIEEGYHAIKGNKPVFLIGGFGGATKSIISSIKGKRPKELTNDFHYDTDFLKKFRESVSSKAILNLDYDYIYSIFSSYTVDSLSKGNGLSIEENEILFESCNIHEIVFLIIKGLQNLSAKS